MLKNYLFISITLFCLQTNASEPDTSYIQNFKNIFSVKTLIYFNDYNYSLSPKNTPGFSEIQLKNVFVKYDSYLPASLGLSFNIRGLNLSFDFRNKMDFLYNEKEKSVFRKLMLSYYGNKAGFEFYFKRFKHFYFDYGDNTFQHKNYLEDMNSTQVGFNTIAVINHKHFSYKAAFNSSAFQKKSAGSVLIIPMWKYERIKNKNFIPDSIQHYYTFDNDIDKIKYNSFLLHIGYGFNIVKNKLYLSGAMFIGSGIQNQKYEINLKEINETVVPVSGMAKLRLGFNGPTFIAGIFANADYCYSQTDALKTKQIIYNYGIFVGLRTIKYKKAKTKE